MAETWDVLVVGGGTAGVVAAVQAARAGARTLLVEKTGMLGGTLTVGGVNYPASFHARGEQVIGGIGWELVEKTLREEGVDPASKIPDAEELRASDTPSRPVHVPVNPWLYACVCDETVVEAGAEIRFYTMPAEVERDGDAWRVALCGKEGLVGMRAAVLVDCSADANVVQLAGFPVEHPETLQPATPVFILDGYDFGSLPEADLRAAMTDAVTSGEFDMRNLGWGSSDPGDRLMRVLRGGGRNSLHLAGVDTTTSAGKSALDLAGRALVLKLYRWLRKQPGLENLALRWLAPETGVRETVVVEGEARITIEDYESGAVGDDAVCYSFYPVDIHLFDEDRGIEHAWTPDGVVPVIPRGAMLPKGSRFLVVAGRHIAGDRPAHSSYRVEAPCMAMGQAAGVMAALSARDGITPGDLDMDAVRTLLREHDAVVPEPDAH